MKALILAAGEGTRLKPLTSNVPKPLLTVAGKPFMTHTIEALKQAGVDEVVILTGFRGDRIRSHYRNGEGLDIKITYLEQKERKGTAHAIGMAKREIDEPFFCLAGDVLVNAEDLKAMRALHEEGDSTVLGAVEVEDPSRFGVIEVKDGRMVGIEEKPQKPRSNMINSSVYLFNPDIFQKISLTGLSDRNEYEVTDSIAMLAAEGKVLVHPMQGEWIDVGQPWDLLKANEKLMASMKRSIEGTVEDGAHIIGDVVVEEGARIRSGSYIEGPVYISAGCDIGPNCHVRAYTCLGPGCRVGNASEVKNSIIMANTKVPHHNYIGDSIIGERCNFGSGTKVANLRFDRRNIKVMCKDGLVDSGRRKMGVVMGDDVETGINAMILPGTVIHEEAVIGAGATAHGLVGKKAQIL